MALANGWRRKLNFPLLVGQFNFTLTGNANPVASWVEVAGDPYAAIVTASDSRSGSAVSISTLGTGATYWNWNGVAAGGYILEADANGSWPAAVGSGYFFNQALTYISGGNFRISGLVVGATYKIEVLSDRPTQTDNRLTTIACIDNGGTETFNDVNSAPASTVTNSVRSQVTNAGTVIIFTNKAPNGSGYIFLGICAAPTQSFGYINAIKITRLS